MVRVAWISAGVSSFLAAYFGKPDRIVYIDVANQHPDSFRFLMDCQRHLDRPIEFLRDVKHGGSVDVCIEKYRYINGPGGAPCTLHQEVRRPADDSLRAETVGGDAGGYVVRRLTPV